MINSRKIEDLYPAVQVKCHAFIADCAAEGINVLITSTYRDMETQAALYNQGRTSPGKIVTNAKPGTSWHNYRCAFDFVPLLDGKPDWNDTNKFKRCGEIAESVGLEWGGNFSSFKDTPHCQYRGGLTFADARAGKVPV